jgi:hypothetical protein
MKRQVISEKRREKFIIRNFDLGIRNFPIIKELNYPQTYSGINKLVVHHLKSIH